MLTAKQRIVKNEVKFISTMVNLSYKNEVYRIDFIGDHCNIYVSVVHRGQVFYKTSMGAGHANKTNAKRILIEALTTLARQAGDKKRNV